MKVPSDFRYADTASEVIRLLSDSEHHIWLQNMQAAFAKGDLYPQALRSIEEFDAFVASRQQ